MSGGKFAIHDFGPPSNPAPARLRPRVENPPASVICPMCGGKGGYHDVCDAHFSERGA